MSSALPFDSLYEHPINLKMCSEITRNGPRAGLQCGRVAIEGGSVCAKHGADLPYVQAAARNTVLATRVEMMGTASEAAEAIIDLVKNAASEAVRLKAATEILDRIGIRGGTELDIKAEVTDTRTADVINDRLSKLATASSRGGQYGRPEEETADNEEDGGQLTLPVPAEREPVEGELLFPPGYSKKHRGTSARIAGILPPAPLPSEE